MLEQHLLRQRLLEEVFDLGGNFRPDKSKALKTRLMSYLKDEGYDPQISDALAILEIDIIESEQNDFEASQELAIPILERLSDLDKWNLFDFRIFAAVVDYADTYDQVLFLAEEALQRLEEYSHEGLYTSIKLCIHVNITHRLLRTKYFDEIDPVSLDRLEGIFSGHFNSVMAICETRHFPLHKAMVMIRKGLFYKDYALANEGFLYLKASGEDELYKSMQDEVKEYKLYVDELKSSKKEFDFVVGKNIRKLRHSRKMTIEDLAVVLDRTDNAIGLIERGERGTTSYNVCKLAAFFNVPISVFYDETAVVPPVSDYKDAQIQKLVGFAKILPEDVLDSIIQIVKAMLRAFQKNAKDRIE